MNSLNPEKMAQEALKGTNLVTVVLRVDCAKEIAALETALSMLRTLRSSASVQPLREPASYRMLTAQDTIEPQDEFLREDCITWAIDPAGVFVGARYQPGSALRVARRRLPGITKEPGNA